MAINQINSADFNYATMLATINAAYVGQDTITITNYDDDTAPQVTAGTIFENDGALFENTALATPTGYAGLTNSTTFYLYYDESGGVFIFSNTAPTFSDAKQGWYNGNDRAFYSMFKDSGGTLYVNKWLIGDERELFNRKLITSNNYVHDATATYNELFDKLSPFIPNTGDTMVVNGGLGTNVISRVERSASNTVTFYYMSGAGSIGNVVVTDGVGTTIATSISW